MSSLRYGLGNDYFNYRTYLHNVMDNGLSVIDTVRTTGIEPGYVLLLKLTGLLGGDYLILNTLTALLILVPTAYIIIKYSKMPWISAWLYLTVTFFYNSMNLPDKAFPWRSYSWGGGSSVTESISPLC